MSILIFILILSFLVFIHELGHYIVARKAGITIEEFGIGYPPRAAKLFRWRGTDFTLNWIPFGGFVRMAGEEEIVAPTKEEKKSGTEKGMFFNASGVAKMAVILAGASVNFLFGIVAFSIVFSIMGIPREITSARIGNVAPGSPAETAGIPVGMEVTQFVLETAEQITISTSQELVAEIQKHRGQSVTLVAKGPCQETVCADEVHRYEVYLRTAEETPSDQGSLGIVFESVYFQKYSWWQMPFQGMQYGLKQALYMGREILIAVGTIGKDAVSKGSLPDELAGPVGIVHQAQSSGLFSEGPLALLSFAGMLSINLAIMNVLPIPPLDGGRAIILLVAPFISKKRRLQIEYYANYTGYVLLLGLIIFISARDIFRLFKG